MPPIMAKPMATARQIWTYSAGVRGGFEARAGEEEGERRGSAWGEGDRGGRARCKGDGPFLSGFVQRVMNCIEGQDEGGEERGESTSSGEEDKEEGEGGTHSVAVAHEDLARVCEVLDCVHRGWQEVWWVCGEEQEGRRAR